MPPKILMVISNLMLASRVRKLLSASFEEFINYADDHESAIRILDTYSYLDLCVCDLASSVPQSPLANYLQNRFARARVLMVADQDSLANRREWPTGQIEVSLPQDETLFSRLCRETHSSLQLDHISHFQVGPRLVVGSWCDWYEAFDTVLKRKLYVARIHPWASQDEQLRFQATTKAMAQAKHDYVRAVYAAGEYEGSSYACLEKFDFPSLADLLERKASISLRTAVRILTTMVSVLRFWDKQKYPHSPVHATNVFVSDNDFVKLENCVDPALGFEPFVVEDLRAIGKAIRILLPREQTPLLLEEIFKKLAAPLQVSFETNLGRIIVHLYDTLAPVTVTNFLRYVDRKAYDGTLFHHVIEGFIAQGGCLNKDLTRIATNPPIINESSNGYRNLRGTIAMARHKEDSDSASSQFIFNLADNPRLDFAPGRPGYAVFGEVSEGMDVVDRIAHEAVEPQGSYFRPVNPVDVTKVEKKTPPLEEIMSDIRMMGEKILSTQSLASRSCGENVPKHGPVPSSLSSSLHKLSISLKKLSKALNDEGRK